MTARRVRTGISTAIALSWLAAGGVLGLASAPMASAATTAVYHGSVSRLHVSPSGLGATRSARPAARHAAVRHTAATTTLWVSNQVPVGNDTGCARPGFSTISSAITAAGSSGDTIKVCAGTYDEQLVIQQSVILQAKGAVTVVAPVGTPNPPTTCDGDGGTNTPNQDIVDICGPGTGPDGINVTITGFTFQGSWPSDVCYDQIYGVAVLGGANLVMSNSTVEDVGGNPQTDGCQGGVGIEVGLALTATTSDPGTATLTNDTVLNYQKNGITVDGGSSNATITGATVTGTGETPSIAQNGIQVSDNATAAITKSSVTGNECDDTGGGCGPNGFTQVQSCGILLFDAGKTTVSGTTSSGNDIGVDNTEGFTWSGWSPPAGWKPVLETLTGMGLHNRYENAFFDEGKSSLASSTLSGGEAGIETAQGSYQSISAVSTATHDTITGTASIASNPSAAIVVASDQAAGDHKVKLTATSDGLDTSNAGGGVLNQSTSVVTATNDWWGDATGPSVWSFGSGSSVTADVNFFPWATDSTFSTLETCIKGSSKITTGNQVVLCAAGGTITSFLENNGTGSVLLIGNKGNDTLNGSSGGVTYIIGGVGGSNVINGRNGTGFIQERGNSNDTLINDSNYTVAAS